MVKTTKPSLARMYNFTLGGSQHIEADRDAVRRLRELVPELADSFWANHAFTQRASSLIANSGVRQFLDIGAGLLGEVNVHDVVRETHPDAAVVYVDHDAEVADHGKRSLLRVGNTAFCRADIRDSTLLRNPTILKLLALDEPVGVLIVGVLDFISDDDDPWKAVRQLVEQLPEGSYLAVSHITDDLMMPAQAEYARHALSFPAEGQSCTTEGPHFRNREEVARFFDGWEMESPYPGGRRGVHYVGLWGAEDPAEADDDPGRWWYAGIARKTADS